MAKLVSKVYGEALFEAAIEAGTVDSLMEEVDAVLAIFRANEEYIKLLNHPKIPVEEKVALLEEAFKGKASNQLVGLLTATVEKGRFAEIENILAYFESKVLEYKKIGIAHVTSASALTDQQKEEVQKLALAGEKRMLAFPLPIVEWEKLEQYRFSTQKGLTTIDSIHFYTFFEDVILTKEEREEKEEDETQE